MVTLASDMLDLVYYIIADYTHVSDGRIVTECKHYGYIGYKLNNNYYCHYSDRVSIYGVMIV